MNTRFFIGVLIFTMAFALFALQGCVQIPVEVPKVLNPVASEESAAVQPPSIPSSKTPLTLKEKLSIQAKAFEQIETSYLPFCTNKPKDLNLFYTTLFYEMIRHESGFNPKEEYFECSKTKCLYASGCWVSEERGFCRVTSSKLDGGYAVSRGLFQMSLSSSRGLGCSWINSKEDLFNEDPNIKCAMHVLKNYIVEDKQIAGKKAGDKWAGGTRYWAVLRNTFGEKPRASYEKIKTQLEKLDGCK